MNDLIKINNTLVDFKSFAAVEFDDPQKCIWCYLPLAPVDHKFEYVTFVVDDLDEYKEIKSYIEGFILNEEPEGYIAPKPPSPSKFKPPKPSSHL